MNVTASCATRTAGGMHRRISQADDGNLAVGKSQRSMLASGNLIHACQSLAEIYVCEVKGVCENRPYHSRTG